MKLDSMGLRTKIMTANATENVFSDAMTKGYPLQIILDEPLLRQNAYELFDRRTLTLQRLKLSQKSANIIKETLSKGDQALLEEQRIRKNEFIISSSRVDYMTRNTHIGESQSNSCYEVAVHDDNACIAAIQDVSVGEYIGTDQERHLTIEIPCYSCGRPCRSLGYISKRL